MAHPFSYSGNAQGCDHIVRHIHTALDTLQGKLGRPAVTESAGTASASGAANGSRFIPPANSPNPAIGRALGAGQPSVSPGYPSGPVIPLSSPESMH